METTVGKFRINYLMSAARITDTTNAGKRGKTCKITSFYSLTKEGLDYWEEIGRNFVDSDVSPEEYASKRDIDYEEREVKAIEVAPADFERVTFENDNISIDIDYDTFRVQNKRDTANEPTLISTGSNAQQRKSAKKMRQIVEKLSSIQSKDFNSMARIMSEQGVNYHRYCAVD